MNLQKKLLSKLLCAALGVSMVMTAAPGQAKAAVSNSHGIPAYLERNVYETERVTIQGITVEETKDALADPVVSIGKIEKPIKFIVFNSITQETEQVVTSEGGELPALSLIKGHNYIIYADDPEYKMSNAYVWVKDDKLYDIKSYEYNDKEYLEKTKLYMEKRSDAGETSDDDPDAYRRVMASIDICRGEGPVYNAKFRLISDVETIEVTSGNNGKIRPQLLEDVNYMVTIDDERYDVEPFPIAIKDKSEYEHSETGKPGGKYAYNHSNCQKVEVIQVVDKGDAHKNDTVLTSESGNTTVTGLNFGDFLLLDEEMDKSLVTGMEDKDYEVFHLDTINPHRWEIAKLAAGDFKVTRKAASGKQVANVYCLDSTNELKLVDFHQENNEVSFTMDSLSLYPVVIEYEPGDTTGEEKPGDTTGEEKPGDTTGGEKPGDITGEEKPGDTTGEEKPGDTTGEEKPENTTGEEKTENKETQVQKVTVSGAYKKVAAGKSIQLTAKVLPDNASDKAVKWTVSNSKYASVSNKGKVTLKKAGAGKTVTVTATAKDGSKKSGQYKIKIMKHAVKKISLTAKKTVQAGKKVTVKADVKTTGKNANKKLTWTTSNKKYATVNAKGVVTSKKAGKGKTVTITAKATDGSGKKKAVKIKLK